MSSISKLPTIRRFFVAAGLIAFLLCAFLVALFEHNSRKDAYQRAFDDLSEQASWRASYFSKTLSKDKDNVHFLHSTPPVSGIVRAMKNNGEDLYGDTTLPQWKQRLETIFSGFIAANADIMQIRFISRENNGRELVSVERRNGIIRHAAEEDLEETGQTELFRAASHLNKDEIYTSAIAPNIEHGKTETPIRPVYQIAKSVFDSENNVFAVVVVTFDATLLLQNLQSDLPDDMKLFVVNASGDYLIHPDKNSDFIGHDTTTNAPAASQLSSERFTGNNGFLSFSRRIFLDHHGSNNFINIYTAFEKETIERHIAGVRVKILLILAVLISFSVTTLWVYQRRINNRMALLAERSTARAIINHSTDAIIGINPDGKIDSWNRGATVMFGYHEKMVLGKTLFTTILDSNNQQITPKAIEDVLAGKVIDQCETRAITQDGSKIYISASLYPISIDTRIIGCAISIRDISEKHRLNEEISRINSNLEHQVKERTQALEIATQKAQQASESKSLFIANVSHEIRTPINGIMGMLSLLKRECNDEKQLHYIRIAESSASALTSQINDILDFSRIGSDRLQLEYTAFNISHLLSSIATSMSVRVFESGVEFVLDSADVGHECLLGDPVRVRQIITNLVSNAVKFTPAGDIILSAGTQEDGDGNIRFYCSVTDTGIGISSDKQDTLFEAFHQTRNSATQKYAGTGLGLSICKQLCERMNGSIRLVQSDHDGTTIAFDILLKPADTKQQPLPGDDTIIPAQHWLIACPNHALQQALGKIVVKRGSRYTTVSNAAAAAQMITDNLAAEYLLLDISWLQGPLLKTLQAGTFHGRMILMVPPGYTPDIPPLPQDLRVTSLTRPLSPHHLDAVWRKQMGWNVSEEKSLPENIRFSIGQPRNRLYRILVVDDSLINQEVACCLLESLDVNVQTADNGQQALDILQQSTPDNPFDLILMDCQMPVLDGFSATEKIRAGAAGEQYCAITIIAMTAAALDGDREKCLQAGMNDYLSKPIDTERFATTLKHWLTSIPSAGTENNSGDDAVEYTERNTRLNAPTTDTRDIAMPAEVASLLVWDRAGALQRLMNKESILMRVVELFINTSGETLQALQDALAAQDISAIQAQAHSLKGVAGNIGGMQLMALSALLEQAAREQDNRRLQDLSPFLPLCYNALMACLQQNQQQH
ncbi:MAG: ATP-binding protein [Saccharospirillaceae bacterium]|nr:ATP-binding protein [Saccharospirillaceae bacterium]MCD8533230.1 ATP-binding protein [Saccharospirillaceae bacterium]